MDGRETRRQLGIRRLAGWLLVWASSVAALGCAGALALGPRQRLLFDGFSLESPGGANWLLASKVQRAVLIGKGVSATHTAFVSASLERPPEGTGDLEELRTYVARGLERPGQSSVEADGRRAVVVESDLQADVSFGVPCVRTDVIQEVHQHPKWPGRVLVMTARTYRCLHTREPGFVLTIRYSERYLKGTESPCCLGEAASFIRSVQFFPFR